MEGNFVLTRRRTNESEKVECNLENELSVTCFKLLLSYILWGSCLLLHQFIDLIILKKMKGSFDFNVAWKRWFCVCVYVCTCAYLPTYMWRSSVFTIFLIFRDCFSLSLELIFSAELAASERQAFICLSSSMVWGYRYVLSLLVFMWMLGSWI